MNVIQDWIDTVAYSHSKSIDTEKKYRWSIKVFCEFIGKTPEQILEEYEGVSDRQFRRKYARYIRGLIGQLNRQEWAVNSVKGIVTGVKTFFRYNDLPCPRPAAKGKVTFHNRPITKKEIIDIMAVSRPRDRAFFCVMAQTGLRPQTLCNLKLKHVEPEYFSEGKTPCKIEVPAELSKGEFGAYYTFMGESSVTNLKAYLATRATVTSESLLFTSYGTDKPFNKTSASNLFRGAIIKLKEKNMIDFEQKASGKPRTVRLYNLRKFFRNHAHQAGIEYVNFWMGHKTNYKAPHISASDIHYFSREDVEFQRQLYAEKASPYLRLETSTPTETEQTIVELRKELGTLKKDYENLKAENAKKIEDLERKHRKEIENLKRERIEKLYREYEEWLRKLVKKEVEMIKKVPVVEG